MPASPQDLFVFLDRLGIRHATVTHPPLFTVADSQSLRGQIAGGHTKNLFLKDKSGSFFLVVADEDAGIDLKQVHHLIGAKRVSFGSSGLLMQHLGVSPGSVTPFGAINDEGRRVQVVLEAELMASERINVHPLTNTMTTGLASADLIRFLTATGHQPNNVAFAESGAASH